MEYLKIIIVKILYFSLADIAKKKKKKTSKNKNADKKISRLLIKHTLSASNYSDIKDYLFVLKNETKIIMRRKNKKRERHFCFIIIFNMRIFPSV